MNIEPRSDTIVLGVPCNFHTLFSFRRARPLAVSVLLQGIKWAIFIRQSMTVRILLNLSETGRLVIKS